MERRHSTVASYRQFTLTIVVLVHVAHARSYVITVGAWCCFSLLHTFSFCILQQDWRHESAIRSVCIRSTGVFGLQKERLIQQSWSDSFLSCLYLMVWQWYVFLVSTKSLCLFKTLQKSVACSSTSISTEQYKRWTSSIGFWCFVLEPQHFHCHHLGLEKLNQNHNKEGQVWL